MFIVGNSRLPICVRLGKITLRRVAYLPVNDAQQLQWCSCVALTPIAVFLVATPLRARSITSSDSVLDIVPRSGIWNNWSGAVQRNSVVGGMAVPGVPTNTFFEQVDFGRELVKQLLTDGYKLTVTSLGPSPPHFT